MKKILLLGAGGFIGSHLAVELLKTKRYDITALDISKQKLEEGISQTAVTIVDLNERTALSDKEKIDRSLSRIAYVELDIMADKNQSRLDEQIKNNDIIVNMIAICNPSLYVSDPLLTFDVGFMGNLKIINACITHGKRLIHFSTSEVYGKSPSIYAKGKRFHFNEEESNLIMGPINKHRWIYASGKQLLERVIHAHGLKNEFNYSIIRPFNYIGQRIDFLPSEKKCNPRVFSHFMDALIHGRPLYLVNGGMQRRSYTYIKDATDAHIRIIENRKNLCNQQIFNVGNPENEVRIKDLAFQMRDIYEKYCMRKNQKLSEIKSTTGEQFYGPGYDDIDRRIPDITKIQALTGWTPRYDLKTMLYEIIQYYGKKTENKT